MTITKILETTLVAGQTSVSFSDAEIPNSILRVYSSDSDLIYETISLTSTTLTVTYPAQTSNKSIALEIRKAGLDIIDSLTSTDTNNALSAKQGKTLNDAIVLVSGNLDTLTETVNNLDIPDSITDLSDVNVTSIQDGQVLAWDDDSQKFVNVDQAGGGINYTETEQDTRLTWIDGKKIYQKTVHINSLPSQAYTTVSYPHNISNGNQIIGWTGYGTFANKTVVPLPLPQFSNSGFLNYASIYASVSTTSIDIMCGTDRSTMSADFTIQYTKTS